MVVVNDVLDLAKIEARQMELQISDFDLRQHLEQISELLAVDAHAKGLEVVCRIDPATPSLVRGDPARLRQVLTNLMGNAVKFTQRGEVSVRLCVEEENDASAKLRCTVTDTGVGFPQERASSLFAPFEQGDTSSTRRYGGTGLGLTISKRLIELMGGCIGVASEVGKGSTFWFSAVLGKVTCARQPQTGIPPGMQDSRILVVDDNSTSRFVLREILESWNCRVHEAADAGTALNLISQAAAASEHFNFVLLDTTLPDMTGEEFVGEIRKDPRLTNTLLVLLRPFGTKLDVFDKRSSHSAIQISKPIWEHTLRDVLANAGLSQTAASQPVKIATTQGISRRNSATRILLVEDNLTNQAVARAMLKKLGYQVEIAVNGMQSLNALAESHFDLFLMDCEMPEMDGYEATRRIRHSPASPENSRIPVVAITANAFASDREKCLQAGMNDYIAKPIDLRQLANVLEKWVVAPISAGELERPSQHTHAATENIFAQEELLTRLMGDKGLAFRAVAAFLQDAPLQLQTLSDTLGRGDAKAALLQAHTLGGAAATVSAAGMNAACSEVQAAIRKMELSRALAMLPNLHAQFELLKATLTQSGWA